MRVAGTGTRPPWSAIRGPSSESFEATRSRGTSTNRDDFNPDAASDSARTTDYGPRAPQLLNHQPPPPGITASVGGTPETS